VSGRPGPAGTLTFSPAGHRYRLDGRPVPSVTTLISGGLPKPALPRWAARTVAEHVADDPALVESLRATGRGPMVAALAALPWQARDTASARGTEVHALAARVAAGEEVDVPDDLLPLVQAAAQFYDDWDVEPLWTEVPVAHRAHWWAGRVDLVARLHRDGGRTWWLDLKTGSGVYPEAALQLAAYAHCEFGLVEGAEAAPPACDAAGVVHLMPGGYDLVPVDAGQETYETFRRVAAVARRARGLDRLLGEPLPAPAPQGVGA